jgi:prepilin-type N-terminal cleavage/methylation domain-containing protein
MRKTPNGFTLLELLVVISIIAIMMSVGFATFSTISQSARDSKRQADLSIVQGALGQYYADQGFFPHSNRVLFNESELSNCTADNIPACPPPGKEKKVYLNNLPHDPNQNTQTPYLYIALPFGCENSSSSTNKCNNYCIFAALENTTDQTDQSIACENNRPANPPYNYYVTSP